MTDREGNPESLDGPGSGGRPPRSVEVDAVVVGTGVAGLSAALELAPLRTLLLSKGPAGGDGSTLHAQGGVAAALTPDDSARAHAEDTLAAGAGLADPSLVRILTEEGPPRVRRLIELGARFDRRPDGSTARGREGAHSTSRVLHAGGDRTGWEILRALRPTVLSVPSIRAEEQCQALDLAIEAGRVVGLLARDRKGELIRIHAKAVILATGGPGRAFRHTTNPPEATGDGIALAARAGATLSDLEFVQFHPTALRVDDADPLPLVSEAVRGEGAILVDGDRRRIMLGVHPSLELAPRDVVARAIWSASAGGREIFLDAREAPGQRFPDRFPNIFARCRTAGIDPRSDLIPITPAEHYHMGGVLTDDRGRSSLPGLWACGEVAATGVHGANRLASNSLLDGLVFGGRAGADARRRLENAEDGWEEGLKPGDGAPAGVVHEEMGPAQEDAWAAGAGSGPSAIGSRTTSAEGTRAGLRWHGDHLGPRPGGRGTRGSDSRVRDELRALMWDEAGLVRSGRGLARALERLSELEGSAHFVERETRNLLLVSRLIVRAALAREESRGSHFRRDHPEPRASWEGRLLVVPFPTRSARPPAAQGVAR